MTTLKGSVGWISIGVLFGLVAKFILDGSMQAHGVSNATGLYAVDTPLGAALRYSKVLPVLVMSVFVGFGSPPDERLRRGALLSVGLIVWLYLQTWQYANASAGCFRSPGSDLSQFYWILGIHARSYAAMIVAVFAGIWLGAAVTLRRPPAPTAPV